MSLLETPPRAEECVLPAPTLADAAGETYHVVPPPPKLVGFVDGSGSLPATAAPSLPSIAPPFVAEPAVAEPAQSAAADPAQPAVVEPAVAEQAQPAIAEPAVPEPAVREPAALEPAVPEPAVAEPAPSVPVIAAPTLAAAAPKAVVPPAHQPDQSTSALSASDWLQANAATATPTRRNGQRSRAGRTLMLTLVAVVLAAGAGAGAHLGYDWYQERNEPITPTAVVVDAGELSGWGTVAPPAIRYTDTTTTITTDASTRVVTAHRDLVSGDRLVTIAETDATGVTAEYGIEVRDGQASIQRTPGGAWEPTSLEEADALVGDVLVAGVYTVSDVFPREILPHLTVLENVERQLTLGTIEQNGIVRAADPADAEEAIAPNDAPTEPEIDPAPEPDPATPGPDAVDVPAVAPPGAPDPAPGVPTAMRHYRVIIDTEAFRMADGAAFETWERQLGAVARPRLEVWIDADGIVRQLMVEREGSTAVQTLVAGAPSSLRLGNPADAVTTGGAAGTAVGSDPASGTQTVVVDAVPAEGG